MLDQQRLDDLWDFDDAAGTEQRLRAELQNATPSDRDELGTQLARALGLQDRFDEAHVVLDGIAGTHPDEAALTRIDLERGRLHNSAGDAETAAEHFRSAVGRAHAIGHRFLEVDALHMLAIAEPDLAAEWTVRALEVLDADGDARTQRWRVGLHNNLGWALFDAGDRTGALRELELALTDARRWGTAQQVTWAEEAIAEASEASAPPE